MRHGVVPGINEGVSLRLGHPVYAVQFVEYVGDLRRQLDPLALGVAVIDVIGARGEFLLELPEICGLILGLFVRVRCVGRLLRWMKAKGGRG